MGGDRGQGGWRVVCWRTGNYFKKLLLNFHRGALRSLFEYPAISACGETSQGRAKNKAGKRTIPESSSIAGLLGEPASKGGERDFSGGPVAKSLCSQCRGPRFDPWPGN